MNKCEERPCPRARGGRSRRAPGASCHSRLSGRGRSWRCPRPPAAWGAGAAAGAEGTSGPGRAGMEGPTSYGRGLVSGQHRLMAAPPRQVRGGPAGRGAPGPAGVGLLEGCGTLPFFVGRDPCEQQTRPQAARGAPGSPAVCAGGCFLHWVHLCWSGSNSPFPSSPGDRETHLRCSLPFSRCASTIFLQRPRAVGGSGPLLSPWRVGSQHGAGSQSLVFALVPLLVSLQCSQSDAVPTEAHFRLILRPVPKTQGGSRIVGRLAGLCWLLLGVTDEPSPNRFAF